MWSYLNTLRVGIATKLYCTILLSLLAVAALAGSAIYFSKTTEDAARVLYGDGFVGVTNSVRLELLLEHHRRIVESMPAEVDRKRIESDHNDLEQIKEKLSNLMKEINSKRSTSTLDSLEERIEKNFPPLFVEAEQVVFYAMEFAQDKATERANRYTDLASGLQKLVESYRMLRMQEARDAIALVNETAKSLVVWVLFFVVVAFILIGPVGLATMRGVLSRLARITQAMARLARNETTTTVPSREDPDEVGEMARAVEVFKDNAIQLIAREAELQNINQRIDVALNNMTDGLCMFDAEQKLIVCNKTYIERKRPTASPCRSRHDATGH